MESLGGGIKDIINKTKHSVYSKWRTFMKKSTFRFEQHFGKTEEVKFKSELEAEIDKQNKEIDELKIIISEQQTNINKLTSSNMIGLLNKVERAYNDQNMVVNMLYDKLEIAQKIIRSQDKEISKLKKELKKTKGGK
jgi:uncharacterized coiled-coil protein SlyX